jgi:TrmH family RNA methyltransferase
MTLPAPPNVDRVRIVLVEPRGAANVGATARAMSTMGLRDLALVRPRATARSREARLVAHHAVDVLEKSVEFDTVLDACGEAALVVGTTNRRRSRVAPDPVPVRDAAIEIARVSRRHHVAILFGNEETGLETADLSHCHLLATIPTVPTRPALNLSHAVMIVAYELFLASLEGLPARRSDPATEAELEALCQRIHRVILERGFRPHEDDPESFLHSLRRAIHRMGLEGRDVRTLHVVLRSLERPGRRG